MSLGSLGMNGGTDEYGWMNETGRMVDWLDDVGWKDELTNEYKNEDQIR